MRGRLQGWIASRMLHVHWAQPRLQKEGSRSPRQAQRAQASGASCIVQPNKSGLVHAAKNLGP